MEETGIFTRSKEFTNGFSAGVEFARRWIETEKELPDPHYVVLCKQEHEGTTKYITASVLPVESTYVWLVRRSDDAMSILNPKEVTHWRYIELDKDLGINKISKVPQTDILHKHIIWLLNNIEYSLERDHVISVLHGVIRYWHLGEQEPEPRFKNWQACPKCGGSGEVGVTNITDKFSVISVCDKCDGDKFIKLNEEYFKDLEICRDEFKKYIEKDIKWLDVNFEDKIPEKNYIKAILSDSVNYYYPIKK